MTDRSRRGFGADMIVVKAYRRRTAAFIPV